MYLGINIDPFQLENPSRQSNCPPISDFDTGFFELKNTKGAKPYKNSSCSFFSEPKSDEFIQNYILYNFSSKDHINIVFGGCSTGRELYGYAMMLDSLKEKTDFIGFDTNLDLIDKARNGVFVIKNTIKEINELVQSNNSEAFLISDNDNLSKYQALCKRKFLEYFKPVTDKEIQKIDSKRLHAINYSRKFLEDMGIGEVKIQEPVIETQTFKFNNRDFRNCTFIQQDVLNINNSINDKAIDAFFFRNTLYQLVCDGNGLMKYMKFNAMEIIEEIVSKIKKTLSPDGILVFGEQESYIQGIDKNIVYDVMINQGFLPIVKCEDLEQTKEDLRKCNKDENDAIRLIANIWRINRMD